MVCLLFPGPAATIVFNIFYSVFVGLTAWLMFFGMLMEILGVCFIDFLLTWLLVLALKIGSRLLGFYY